MKRTIRRLGLLLLAACLLATTALAALYDPTDRNTLALADSVTLVTSGMELTEDTGSTGGIRPVVREHILTYTPDDTVWPVVAYGSTLYGRSTMAQTAKYLTAKEMSCFD